MDYVVQIDWLKHSTAEAIDDGTGKLIEIAITLLFQTRKLLSVTEDSMY